MSPTLPPGPPAWTALSNLRHMRRDSVGFFAQLARRYGDVAMARVGPLRICLVSHPDWVREVLVTQNRNFIKSRVLQRARVLLGDGLLTSEGEHHLRQRRMMQPAFHRDRITGYGQVMTELSKATAGRWADGAKVDMHREMMRLTLAIAGQTLFSANVEEEADEIGTALSTALGMFGRLTSPLAPLLDRLPLPSTRRFFRARDRLDATIARIVRERRADGHDYGDLLSMLLAARDEEGGGGMSDVEVRDEALTLFLAGHETTANALTWSWYLLSEHPESARRLHAELDTVLGDRPATMEDMPRLPFTRSVLAESMRLFPPAYVIGRQALQTFPVDGYTIPGGSMVLASPWVVHRDPRFFPEPERFLPERWSPDYEESLPRFTYFPFGAGPRKCIGESFAWTEGVLVLATLAHRWRARLIEGHPVERQAQITLRPRYGMRMMLTRREQWAGVPIAGEPQI